MGNASESSANWEAIDDRHLDSEMDEATVSGRLFMLSLRPS